MKIAQYEKVFNALDVEKQVPFFAEHFISAGPRGSIALGRDEFAKRASKVWGISQKRRADIRKNSFHGRNPDQQRIFDGQNPLERRSRRPETS